MKSKVFSIFDSKVQAYMSPFMGRTIGEIERVLSTHVNDESHNFCKFAEDFALYELGHWDEQTGKYDLHDAPISISRLSAYKRA